MPKPAANQLRLVGECLYRSDYGVYFALVKVGGKQIKRSLKTNDCFGGDLAEKIISARCTMLRLSSASTTFRSTF
jgi:hypothetical protein